MKLNTLALAPVLLCLVSSLFAAENYPVKIERAVSIKMRDGITLRGDIFRPDAEGKFPVLLGFVKKWVPLTIGRVPAPHVLQKDDIIARCGPLGKIDVISPDGTAVRCALELPSEEWVILGSFLHRYASVQNVMIQALAMASGMLPENSSRPQMSPSSP